MSTQHPRASAHPILYYSTWLSEAAARGGTLIVAKSSFPMKTKSFIVGLLRAAQIMDVPVTVGRNRTDGSVWIRVG